MNSIEAVANQVICADCTTFLAELPKECINLIVTDPPYLVNYTPGDGRRCVNDNSASWVRPAFRQLFRVLKPDRFLVTFYGWPWVDIFMEVWKETGFRPVSHLVWTKSHCSREGYTRSFHEGGFLLAKGAPPRSPKPLSDLLPWQYTGNGHHTNEKPVIAIRPLIEVYSAPGDIVLDPFAGSGTTGVAAKTSGRRFILIEKVQWHCNTARRRLLD